MPNYHFQLTLQLGSGFYLDYPLTLDALLSAAVFHATGKAGRESIAHIPLAREKGLFRASALHYGKRIRHTTLARKMGFRGEADMHPRLFAPNSSRRDQRYLAIERNRGKYKTNMDSYPAIEAVGAWFWGFGDGEACAELIRNFILGIGKRANAGAGEILAVELDPAADHSWVTPRGAPARPLPVEIWREIRGKEYPTEWCAVDVPYWCGPKVEAVVPNPAGY